MKELTQKIEEMFEKMSSFEEIVGTTVTPVTPVTPTIEKHQNIKLILKDMLRKKYIITSKKKLIQCKLVNSSYL